MSDSTEQARDAQVSFQGFGAAHTPGPWHHVPEDNLIMTHAGRFIAEWTARSTHVSQAERDANASLIAAAPELLAALEELVAEHDEPFNFHHETEGFNMARAAIRKAKGKA